MEDRKMGLPPGMKSKRVAGGFTPRQVTAEEQERFRKWCEENKEEFKRDFAERQRVQAQELQEELKHLSESELMTLCKQLEDKVPEFKAYQADYFNPLKRIMDFYHKQTDRGLKAI